MTPGYGDSFTVWCSPDPGTTLWPFIFKGDYIDKKYVKVRYKDYNGAWYDVPIDVRNNFSDDFTLIIAKPVIPPCLMIDIYRDTPKDQPIVIYSPGGTLLADESRNAAARQSMHVVAELVDLAHRQDLECKCDCVEHGGS